MTRNERIEKLACKLQNMVRGVETCSDSLMDSLTKIIDAQNNREVVHQIMRKNIRWASGMARCRLQCTVWGY